MSDEYGSHTEWTVSLSAPSWAEIGRLGFVAACIWAFIIGFMIGVTR